LTARVRSVRAGLAGICLVVVAVSLVSPLQPEQTRARLNRLRSALSGDPGYRSERFGFWFDPEYLAFLEDVDRLVPKDASVAVLVPRRPDLYKYQANYRLAPRRVVDETRTDEADVVAIYKTEIGRFGESGGAAVTGGRLWMREHR
jgi:hypothetical protein